MSTNESTHDDVLIIPLNIWNNIDRISVDRLDIVFEGNRIVGIHNVEWENAVTSIDFFCKKLQEYKSELQLIYGLKKKPKNRSSFFTFIYLFKCNRTGYYKIGRSINPTFREKTINSENQDIKNIFTSPLTHPKKEKELHSIFKEKRVRGEWFKLTDEDVLTVKSYSYGEEIY